MHEDLSPSTIASWPTPKLEDELALRAVRMAALMGEYLLFLGELDRRNQLPDGFLTLPSWLSWRIGLDLDTAREHVRVARALRDFPKTVEMLCAGRVSYSKARAITRTKRPEIEDTLLDIATNATAAQTEKLVKKLVQIDPSDGPDRAERIEHRRSLDLRADEDGMLLVTARLAPEEGVLLRKALEAARRELWQKTAAEGTPPKAADVFVQLVERSLSGGSRASDERTMVLVHVDADDLKTAAGGVAVIDDGPAIPLETVRRLACDATTATIVHDGDEVQAGRRRRVLSPTLRRALNARDEHTCQFPGCHHQIVDAHHIVHWAAGGPTELGNLTSLCRSHHTLVHEQGYRVVLEGGRARFYNPGGREILSAAPLPEVRIAAMESSNLEERDNNLTARDVDDLDCGWVVALLADRLEPGIQA